MKCRKCGSSNMTPLSKTTGKIKKRGCLGTSIHILLTICTGGLWIIIPLLTSGSKGKIKTKTVYVCNECGHEQKAAV